MTIDNIHIAFCFLTANASGVPHQAAVWQRFLTSMEDGDGVFLHAKFIPNDDDDSATTWWREHATWIRPTVSTRWGDVSIVRATLALFDTAFRATTPTTTHFMLLSESCIPLWSLADMRDIIAATPNAPSWLMAGQASDCDRWRHARVDPQKWPWQDFLKQHQWMLLRRDDVAFFLQHQDAVEDFQNVPIPDEHVFASLLARHQRPFLCRLPTFVRWRPHQAHPDSFDVVDDALLREARRSSLFLRKVRPDTRMCPDAVTQPIRRDG